MLSKILWLTGSAIFVFLGTIHLLYTFFTTKLYPRNSELIDEMKITSLRLTKETTVWKAWKGFNASHASGAIFMGLINILLVNHDFAVIENSFPIPILTIVTAVFYSWLARKYWFSIPFGAILVAVCCFIISPLLSYFF